MDGAGPDPSVLGRSRDQREAKGQLDRAERLLVVRARDGDTCTWCRRVLFGRVQATTDHVVPKVKGGPSWLENEVAACRRCNGERGPRVRRVLRLLLAAIGTRGGQRRGAVAPGDAAAPRRPVPTLRGTMVGMSSASRALAGLFAFTGTLHLVRPHTFDRALPGWLPGTKRAWAVGSGLAELACGALVAHPRTRRVGGLASAALLVVVFPGNVHMARTARTPRGRAVTLLRLPLQVPLVWWAWRVAAQGRGWRAR